MLELCNGGSLKDAVTCGRIRTNSCQDLVSHLSGAGSMYCAVLLRCLCWTDWLSAGWHPGGLGDCNADGHVWCVQARLLSRLLDAANGLAYLHNQGVIHGDLKAANVLLQHSAQGPYGQVRAAAAAGACPQDSCVTCCKTYVCPCMAVHVTLPVAGRGSCGHVVEGCCGLVPVLLLLLQVAKVSDFGVSARLLDGATHRSTTSLGTITHMA